MPAEATSTPTDNVVSLGSYKGKQRLEPASHPPSPYPPLHPASAGAGKASYYASTAGSSSSSSSSLSSAASASSASASASAPSSISPSASASSCSEPSESRSAAAVAAAFELELLEDSEPRVARARAEMELEDAVLARQLQDEEESLAASEPASASGLSSESVAASMAAVEEERMLIAISARPPVASGGAAFISFARTALRDPSHDSLYTAPQSKAEAAMRAAASSALAAAAAAAATTADVEGLRSALDCPAARLLSARPAARRVSLQHVEEQIVRRILSQSSASASALVSACRAASAAEVDSEVPLAAFAVNLMGDWGRSESRILVVTSAAVYRCETSAYGGMAAGMAAVRERVEIDRIEALERKSRSSLTLKLKPPLAKAASTVGSRSGSGSGSGRKKFSSSSQLCVRQYTPVVPEGVSAEEVRELMISTIAAAVRLRGRKLPVGLPLVVETELRCTSTTMPKSASALV